MVLTKPYPPRPIDENDWDELVDMMTGGRGRVQFGSYLFDQVGAYYQAINGTTGKPEFEGDLDDIMKAAIDELPPWELTYAGETTYGKMGCLYFKARELDLDSLIKIPPGSMLKFLGSGCMGEKYVFLPKFLVANGAGIEFEKGTYTWLHSYAHVEGLHFEMDGTGQATNSLKLQGAHTAIVRDCNFLGKKPSTNDSINILLDSSGINHTTIIENVSSSGAYRGLYIDANHLALRNFSAIENKQGIYVHNTPTFLKRGGLYDIQLFNNDEDLVFRDPAPSPIGPPVYCSHLFLEHTNDPGVSVIKLNGKPMVIDVLVYSFNITADRPFDDITKTMIKMACKNSNDDENLQAITPLKYVGQVTITAGNTYADVTHGMAATPNRFSVTPRNQNGKDWWIDNVGGSTFRINIPSVLGSDAVFDIEARAGL